MSVAHTSKLVHAGDESITNHSPYFSVRSWALYGRPLYGQPFWFQIYRVWPVDDFQILLRGRGRFGRGPFSPVTPVIATCIKSGGTPSHDITLIKTKMTARDGKRFISTFLRKNSGL